MLLATVIARMRKDPALSALGCFHGHYVSLVRGAKAGLVLDTSSPVFIGQRPMRLPFDVGAADPGTKCMIAQFSKEVDWTLFRGGLPVEEGEASQRRATRQRHPRA